VGPTCTQVEAYITDEGINLRDVPALITTLKTGFGDPDRMVTTERKLEALKQRNHDFSSYYVELQRHAVNIQWNDPAKRCALKRGLDNEIEDTLVLSDNVLQQFQEFIAFL
jgi:hypothetical protein